MNFNYNDKPEYNLASNMTDEVIKLYGVPVKFLVTEKVNKDDLFGDFSHLKTDSKNIFEIYGLPETSDMWDNMGGNFTEYGLMNIETTNLFVHINSLEFIDFDAKGFDSILGNLIITPSNRILEITDFQFEVPGLNNLFMYKNDKNVFKLSLRTYQHKIINEVKGEDLVPVFFPGDDEYSDYNTLDSYFDELIGIKENQDKVKTDAVSTVIVKDGSTTDKKVLKPVVSEEEKSVFGSFE